MEGEEGKEKANKASTSLDIHTSGTTEILLGLLAASETSLWGEGGLFFLGFKKML